MFNQPEIYNQANCMKHQQQNKTNEDSLSRSEIKSEQTGMPDRLKSGIEGLSGYSLDDVKVHYNSPRPEPLKGHAHAQDKEIQKTETQPSDVSGEPLHPVQEEHAKVNPFPVLVTDRLILRQFQETDIESVYYGLSHPEVIKHYGVHYNSLSATWEQIAWFKKIEKEETGIWWAVCDRHHHTFLGAVGFNNWNKENRKIEMGYWLLPEFWGSGMIKEAAQPACSYAFKNMRVHRIEAFVETENKNSKKVLNQLGFEFEGTMKDCEIKDGRFISLEIYAKLNSE